MRAALPLQAAATWASVQPASSSTFSSARALRSAPFTPGQSVRNTILSTSIRSSTRSAMRRWLAGRAMLKIVCLLIHLFSAWQF
jgi:hypothetical protein